MRKTALKRGEYIAGGSFLRRFTPMESDNKRVGIRLAHAHNFEAVYWSKTSNSYVVVESPTGFWTAPNGIPCDVLSINGMGEIRWAVTSQNGSTAGDTDAAEYFGLTWYGWGR